MADTGYTVGPVGLDGEPTVLGQYDPQDRWNGWLCPRIDAYSVVYVLTELNAAYDQDPEMGYDWDWDTEGRLILTDRQWLAEDPENYKPEVLAPDEDGLYPLGTYSWTWCVDPDYGATPEWRTWVREYRTVWVTANNENNMRLIGEGVMDRFRLNEQAAKKAVAEWVKDHPEPPKYPHGEGSWVDLTGKVVEEE